MKYRFFARLGIRPYFPILTYLTTSVPELHRLEVGGVLSSCSRVDPGDLSCVVLDECLGFFALHEICCLGLSEGRHVIILAGLFRVLKIMEVDGVNVIYAIR